MICFKVKLYEEKKKKTFIDLTVRDFSGIKEHKLKSGSPDIKVVSQSEVRGRGDIRRNKVKGAKHGKIRKSEEMGS